MSNNTIVWLRLVFGLFCYIFVGFLFASNPFWAEALGMNEALAKGRGLALARASLIILALSLTWGLAWNKVSVMSWAEGLGWAWVLACGVGLALGLVMGGGITLTVIWAVVVSVAWAGAWCLVGAKSQLLLSFSQLHTVLILAGTSIFGLGLGWLWRLISTINP